MIHPIYKKVLHCMIIIWILTMFVIVFPFTKEVENIINTIATIVFIIQLYFVYKLFKI